MFCPMLTTMTMRKKTMIEEMRVCPFDGLLVVCDSDCDNCDYAEDEDDGID